MIRYQKASTYGDRMTVIGEWMKGSYVFLYHNGVGIIAAAKGTANIQDQFNEVLNDDERFIKLKSFVSAVDSNNGNIKNAIQPGEIKKILNRDFYFANTIVPLSDEEGEKLFSECRLRFDH